MDLKDLAYATAQDPAVQAHIKAALMRAWVDLQEMAMAIRGQGKPKPIEARNAVSKRRTKEHAAPISTQTGAREANGAQTNSVNGGS
jgi:hypothetical protein